MLLANIGSEFNHESLTDHDLHKLTSTEQEAGTTCTGSRLHHQCGEKQSGDESVFFAVGLSFSEPRHSRDDRGRRACKNTLLRVISKSRQQASSICTLCVISGRECWREEDKKERPFPVRLPNAFK